MKSYREWRGEPISSDELQDELILIQHHIGDIKESLHKKDIKYALEGLADIEDSVKRLSKSLTPVQNNEFKRATGE